MKRNDSVMQVNHKKESSKVADVLEAEKVLDISPKDQKL